MKPSRSSHAAIVATLVSTACGHHHLERNAPGVHKIRQPPERLESREVEEPDDPGEQMIALAYGGMASGSVAFGGSSPHGDDRLNYGVGPEVSVYYGTSPSSHEDDQFFVYMERGYGINLGWTALSREGEGLGPLYGELQYSSLPAALAAGWAYDVNDEDHGPQVTFSAGPFYARVVHMLELGTQLHLGLVLKGHYLFVWSQ